MSDNDSLPTDLTNLEMQLRGLPLPAAKLSREATLYQCGWAAAEARFRGQQSRRAWIWQASSGVLAASVVVLSVLLVKQDDAPQVAEAVTPAGAVAEAPTLDTVVEHASATAPGPSGQASFDFAVRFAPDDKSLLAVRERALRGILPEPLQTADQGEIQFREPKTRRELLNELIERNVHS